MKVQKDIEDIKWKIGHIREDQQMDNKNIIKILEEQLKIQDLIIEKLENIEKTLESM